MPTDRTALRGRRVDARSRIAWLLRVNRLARGYGVAAEFTKALARHDLKIGPTTLSRYETGTEPVSGRVLLAYERTLDLPPGRLLGVCYGVHRVFGPALAEVWRPPQSRPALSALLGELEQRIDDGTVTGVDRLTGARLLTDPDGAILPLSVQEGWIRCLADELMRSVGHGRATRVEALSLMARGPETWDTTWRVVRAAVEDPDAQGVSELVTALGESPNSRVLRWLVDLLEHADGARQWGAAMALLQRISAGTFPGDLLPELTRAVLVGANDGGPRAHTAYKVAQRVSPGLTRQVVTAIGRMPEEPDPGMRVQSPDALGRYLHAAQEVSGLVDPMLERLLREALSPDFIERRHSALLLLSFSPYREVLADTALELARGTDTACAADTALTCLVHLAGAEQADGLDELLTVDRPADATRILLALARGGGLRPGTDLATWAADDRFARAAVYAAGLTGHPALLTVAQTRAGTAPGRHADWWLRLRARTPMGDAGAGLRGMTDPLATRPEADEVA